MDKENFIMLNTSLISKDTNNNLQVLSDEVFSVYVALMIEHLKASFLKNSTFIVNATNLSFDLYNQDSVTKDRNKAMSINLRNLFKQTNIKYYTTPIQGYYEINTESMEYNKIVDSEKKIFTKVPVDGIMKIYQSAFKGKKRLLRYYCYLLAKVSGKKKKVAFATRKEIYESLGYASDTVTKYNKVLEELELIKFYDKFIAVRPDVYKGTIFSTWDNQQYIDSYIEEKFHNVPKLNKAEISYHKSMMMKYRNLEKGKEYPFEELREIWKFVTESNSKNQMIINSSNSTDKEKEQAKAHLLDGEILENARRKLDAEGKVPKIKQMYGRTYYVREEQN